jgi:hypothetical protein
MKTTTVILTAILTALVASSCSSIPMQQVAKAEPVLKGKKHRQCISCHITRTPKKGDQLFAEGIDQSSVCLSCHDYRENHHPVDFPPTETVYVSSGKAFPLYQGKIRCITCHDQHGGTGLGEDDSCGGLQITPMPNFLRGGSRTDRRAFCFQCHFQERYAEIDPHIMLDDNGKPMSINGAPVCTLCHQSTPTQGSDRVLDPRLRADVTFLCWRCHPPMPGDFYKHHFGVKASAQTARYMKKSEQDLKVLLPLTPAGRTTCSTCHNPHQKDALVYEPARTGADSQQRLRLPSQEICLACHPGR